MFHRCTRRRFLQRSIQAGAGFWIAGLPGQSQVARAASKLNLGIIGAGGRGWKNLEDPALSSQNIVAICDVDTKRAGKAFERFPKAARYTDFRKMLDDQKDVEAVVISTPDHTHAAASVMAMRLGKHVYCEKPLTHDIYEARILRQTAAHFNVATQMGNQWTSAHNFRYLVEAVQDGLIGAVTEVHVWTNRPIWPQGMDRPSQASPVPKTFDWDLWLGPAPARAYNAAYAPFKWRGWVDFGTGTIGDMACHTVNLPYVALRLGLPTAVEAQTAAPVRESYPVWSVIAFDFPARGTLPPVRLTWYDGGKKPPDRLVPGIKLPNSGAILVGDKGTLYSPGDYGWRATLLQGTEHKTVAGDPKRMPKSPGHYEEWLDACRGGPPALSHFDHAAVFTEAMLLGNVALRAGTRIVWDADSMRVSNCPQANAFVRRDYRQGWTL